MESCIYEGWIRHRRYSPVENSFRVRVSLIYLALEELQEVFAGRWCWSTGRAAIARFRRSDYLGPADEDLRVSVAKLIESQGGRFSGGPIRLLTHLRYWGIGFNPVSFYYCFQKAHPTQLEYLVAEVTNTPWGQKHAYVLSPEQFHPVQAQVVKKSFHVSPFMDLEMNYRFGVTPPGPAALVQMANLRGQQRLFDVTMRLKRRPISTRNLARVLLRYPAMTAQVMGQIYLQAARLWWKGVPYVPHPQPGRPHGNLAGGLPSSPNSPLISPPSDSAQTAVSMNSSSVSSIVEARSVNSHSFLRFEDNDWQSESGLNADRKSG